MAVWGGSEGRRLTTAIILAIAATAFAQSTKGRVESSQIVLIVDGLLLAYALKIALGSEAYWPLWFCGFHALSFATGLSSWLFPSSAMATYVDLAGFWALPAQGAAAFGILRDRSSD